MTTQKANNIWKFVHSVLLTITSALLIWVGSLLLNGYQWFHEENKFREKTTEFIANQKVIDERQDNSLNNHVELFNTRQIIENNLINEIQKTNQKIEFLKAFLHINF